MIARSQHLLSSSSTRAWRRETLLPLALRGVDTIDVQLGIRQWISDEEPDADDDDRIDPMAGHGTFIAGIIKRIAPSCRLRVQGPLSGYGDVSEHDIGAVLDSLLALRPNCRRPC